MGLCSSNANNGPSAEDIRDREIEAQLAKANKIENKKIKLLLLGAGESGKSTFFKQIDILYGTQWSSEKKEEFKPIVYENTIDAMKTILTDGFDSLGNVALPPDIQVLRDKILAVQKGTNGTYQLDPGTASTIQQLWSNDLVLEAYKNRSSYQLYDSAAYFFDRVEQIADQHYTPSPQDILHSRVRTTGIHEKSYTINETEFLVVDVGGQRNERKKWIHCFEDVTAVIFLASLSAYDQVLFEKANVNRLNEAVALFEHIVNSSFFQKPSMILFLNKDDLFREKIKHKSLRNDERGWFTDYEGGCDHQEAYNYIKDKFINKCQDPQKRDMIFVSRTTATDTRNMEEVFTATKETILERAFGELGGM